MFISKVVFDVAVVVVVVVVVVAAAAAVAIIINVLLFQNCKIYTKKFHSYFIFDEG